MRILLIGRVAALAALSTGLGGTVLAQPKGKPKAAAEGDKEIEKQSAWEQKVMGKDGAKASDMKKIAAARKIADGSRKNPPPIAAPRVKDPSKEGVRAKQEAAIGLPIPSDDAARAAKEHRAARKPTGGSPTASTSANDELGSLVAHSLAEDKAAQGGKPPAARSPAPAHAADGSRSATSRGRSPKARARATPASALDKLLGGVN